MWNWHNGWTHNDAFAAEPSQVVPSHTPWQCSANIDELGVHDPWRTPRDDSNTSVGVRCRGTRFARSASETKASLPETSGPRGKSGAAPSAWSSGAFPQFGPTPRQLLLRHCPADMFEDVSIDGSNIDDAFTDGGISDPASVRRQHTTVKGDEVASSLVSAEKRLRTPQPPRHTRQEETLLSILSLDPGPNASLREPSNTKLLDGSTGVCCVSPTRRRLPQVSCGSFSRLPDTLQQAYVRTRFFSRVDSCAN